MIKPWLALLCLGACTAPRLPAGSPKAASVPVWESGHRYPVNSTGFAAAWYENKSMTLTIERAAGEVYEYYNVPRSVFVKFMDARFKTGYLGAYIENRYKRKKVNSSALSPLP